MKRFSLARAMSAIGSWTLLSRLLGFIREVLFAALFGSGPIAEAFQVAFALPNMFRRFFAEGAFNTAYVPMFSKKLGTAEASRFANEAFSLLTAFLLILVVLANLLMPVLVWLMASGFRGDARFALATDYGRVVFPYIFFISLMAMISGSLNALGRFSVAAAAPVLLNICLIAVMAFGIWRGASSVISWLIWSIPVAGLAQLALVWFALERAGFKLRFQIPRLTPEMKSFLVVFFPAALAGGVVQINFLIGRQVASVFEGAIQWLAVADRLYQLPLGVIGTALGVALLPMFSHAIKKNDTGEGNRAFENALLFSMALTLPSMALLFTAPLTVLSVLFERGMFLANDALQSARALMIYALGLPAFVLLKIYQPVFFSRGDTRRPYRVAIIGMIINAVLAVSLMRFAGFLAAALGTSISAYAMLICLILLAKRDPITHISAEVWRILALYLFSTLALVAGVHVLDGMDWSRIVALIAIMGLTFLVTALNGVVILSRLKSRASK